MEGGLRLAALSFFLGWLLSPLLRPLTPPGPLDDVGSWALQGPGREIPIPLMGVYVFKGLNPVFMFDMSYARSWDSRTRSVVIDMGGAGMYALTDASSKQMVGEFKSTSPDAPLSGAACLRLFAVLRHTNTFVFNEDFTRAHVVPSFGFPFYPLAFVARAKLREEMVLQRGGVWKRVNFHPPTNSTPTEAHYFLHPVVTKRADGTAKVRGAGLRMARRKLVMGNSTFAHIA